MPVRVFIDGAVTDGESATVSVFDRGFLYGDSVYEVMRTSGGKPVDLERHLERLERSAAALLLSMPTLEAVRAAIEATLTAAGNAESYVRIILTRGAGVIGLDTNLADGGRLVVIVKELTLPADELYERGAGLRIVGVRRTSRAAMDPSVKSGNYLNNILALAEARRAGADEAVMLSPDGLVAEGASSNVFAATGGSVITPALAVGLLAGITRQRVIELASGLGIAIREGALTPERLCDADEVFITSSVRGVMPIATIDDQKKSAPGPLTARLMAAYQRFLEEVASSP